MAKPRKLKKALAIAAKAEAALTKIAEAAKTVEGRSRVESVQLHAGGYAEPGYADPASGVIALGNWNRISRWQEATRDFATLDEAPCLAAAALEKLGVELEWEDEWCSCDECHALFRHQPNGYGWRMYGINNEEGCVCGDCLKKDPADYLKGLEGRTSNCVTMEGLDFDAAGYHLVQADFENGWHGGQAADPRAIGKTLKAAGLKRFVFKLDSTGQFDMAFSVWLHESEDLERAQRALATGKTDGPDPAEAMRRSLQASSAAEAAVPPGEGMVVTTCHADGTATARRVSPQDFVDGKAFDRPNPPAGE